MRTLLRQPFDDLASCLTRLAESPRPLRAMCVVLVALVATWFIYVPVHELLHVLGCVTCGGNVSELEIAPQYGGALLARWFPFVVSGGDYAGRLSGFDTKGSDLIYLATDFAPFLLSVLIGVPLLRMCAKRRRLVLFGVAIVVGLAPFYNLIGDYYEMGSIITTRMVTLLGGGADPVTYAAIRSDDVFKLIGTFCMRPGELNLHGAAGITLGAALILASIVVGVVLAFLTYSLGDGVARIFYRLRGVPWRPPQRS